MAIGENATLLNSTFQQVTPETYYKYSSKILNGRVANLLITKWEFTIMIPDKTISFSDNLKKVNFKDYESEDWIAKIAKEDFFPVIVLKQSQFQALNHLIVLEVIK